MQSLALARYACASTAQSMEGESIYRRTVSYYNPKCELPDLVAKLHCRDQKNSISQVARSIICKSRKTSVRRNAQFLLEPVGSYIDCIAKFAVGDIAEPFAQIIVVCRN